MGHYLSYLLCIPAVSGLPRQSFNEDTDTLTGFVLSAWRLNNMTLHSINQDHLDIWSSCFRGSRVDARGLVLMWLESDNCTETSEPTLVTKLERGKSNFLYMKSLSRCCKLSAAWFQKSWIQWFRSISWCKYYTDREPTLIHGINGFHM